VGPTTNARFSGAELRQALEAEGLVFGRYHIFHREVDDKQLLFSVASLIEPGSFELHEMSTLELPGVSLFAVLPGAVEGTHVVDELVACGRRLAGRLNGVLQDERRQPLTAVRVMELRDEVASFERSLFADGTDDAD
jgi:cell division protein ZipA